MVLYTVSAAAPVAGAGGATSVAAFPEQCVRDVSCGLLRGLARAVAEGPALLERIAYALVFTRNVRLRGNIFASLLLLAADSPELRRSGLCSVFAVL